MIAAAADSTTIQTRPIVNKFGMTDIGVIGIYKYSTCTTSVFSTRVIYSTVTLEV